jgi:hypothetical protein
LPLRRAALLHPITTLNNTLQTETGKSSVANAVDYLATQADLAGVTASKVTTIESSFTSATGQTTVASAISTMWAKANASGTTVGYSLTLNNNGYVIGFQLANGGAGSGSYFRVAADRFIVDDPNNTSPTPVFQIVGGAAYINGTKIQTGTVTSTQVSETQYGIGGAYIPSWTITNQLVFPAGTVNGGSRCLVSLNMTGHKTSSGSSSNGYFFQVQRYAWDAAGNGYFWTTLPGKCTFNMMETDGVSQSFTFIDDSIDDSVAAHDIYYKPIKSLRSNSGGYMEGFTMIGLMCKK